MARIVGRIEPSSLAMLSQDWPVVEVDIRALNVDYTYQRAITEEDRGIIRMAKDYSPAAASVLVVGRRPDKSLWIIDGQRRWLAALRNGGTALWCKVVDTNGAVDESELFLMINQDRKHVSAIEKFRANLAIGKSPYVEINSYITSLGLKFVSKTHTPSHVKFCDTIVTAWSENEIACKSALDFNLEIVRKTGEMWQHSFFSGAFYLIKHNVLPIHDHADRIAALGGIAAYNREHARIRAELGAGSVGVRQWAAAILRVVNYRLHRKYNLPVE